MERAVPVVNALGISRGVVVHVPSMCDPRMERSTGGVFYPPVGDPI